MQLSHSYPPMVLRKVAGYNDHKNFVHCFALDRDQSLNTSIVYLHVGFTIKTFSAGLILLILSVLFLE